MIREPKAMKEIHRIQEKIYQEEKKCLPKNGLPEFTRKQVSCLRNMV